MLPSGRPPPSPPGVMRLREKAAARVLSSLSESLPSPLASLEPKCLCICSGSSFSDKAPSSSRSSVSSRSANASSPRPPPGPGGPPPPGPPRPGPPRPCPPGGCASTARGNEQSNAVTSARCLTRILREWDGWRVINFMQGVVRCPAPKLLNSAPRSNPQVDLKISKNRILDVRKELFDWCGAK